MPGEFAMKQALWKGCHERSASGCVVASHRSAVLRQLSVMADNAVIVVDQPMIPQHFVGGAPTINARLEAETPVTICGISHWIQWFKADFRTVDESLSAQPKGGPNLRKRPGQPYVRRKMLNERRQGKRETTVSPSIGSSIEPFERNGETL